MDMQLTALATAGVIGSGVALFHGVLMQRYMVRPIAQMARQHETMRPVTLRLVPLLLHFSTFVWFLGGITLVAAAIWFGPDAKLTTIVLVGSTYAFGAVGNFWATRGRHPGWMLLALALVLMAFSARALTA